MTCMLTFEKIRKNSPSGNQPLVVESKRENKLYQTTQVGVVCFDADIFQKAKLKRQPCLPNCLKIVVTTDFGTVWILK